MIKTQISKCPFIYFPNDNFIKYYFRKILFIADLYRDIMDCTVQITVLKFYFPNIYCFHCIEFFKLIVITFILYVILFYGHLGSLPIITTKYYFFPRAFMKLIFPKIIILGFYFPIFSSPFLIFRFIRRYIVDHILVILIFY